MSRSPIVGFLVALALLRVAAAGVDDDVEALVATQRPAGGWTFASPPGTRPEAFTLVVRTAERMLAPIGLARWDLVVVRSPGTPAAGLVLLDAYRRRPDERYLAAARRAGDFLVATQLAHGGWFSELPAVGATTPWWFRVVADTRAMLDDDVTPGAVRFLVALWQATGDARYRAAAERGIALMQAAQLPSGAWPLDARPAWLRRLRPHYEDQPALNDGATPFGITTFLHAGAALGRADLVRDARRAGDWLLSVQRGAGWAQQYTSAGEPAAARRFELPALASWETRYAIDALLALALASGDRRYCDGALTAARWLERARVGPSCWARFYDAGDGTPIFADAEGRRVRSSSEARPGYSWMGEFGIPSTLARAGIGDDAAPRRLPGDPGRCREDPSPPRPLAGARAIAAEAAIGLAAGAPRSSSPCVDASPDSADSRTGRTEPGRGPSPAAVGAPASAPPLR